MGPNPKAGGAQPQYTQPGMVPFHQWAFFLDRGDKNWDQGEVSHVDPQSRFVKYDQTASLALETFYQKLVKMKEAGNSVMNQEQDIPPRYRAINGSEQLYVSIENTQMRQMNVQSGFKRKVFRC